MEAVNVSMSPSLLDDNYAVFVSMVVRAVFVTLVALTGIVGNIINILVIPRVPDTSISAASKVVLTALAITDLVGAVMLLNGPLSIFTYEWLSRKGNIYCDITGFITTLAPAISASYIFLINLDRYIQITRPLTYHVLVTKKKAIIAVIAASLYILIFLLFFVSIPDESVDRIAYQYGFSLCLVSFSAPAFVVSTVGSFTVSVWLVAFLLLAMYARIFQIALHHSKKINAQLNSTARLRDVMVTQGHEAFSEDHGIANTGDVIIQVDANILNTARRKLDWIRRSRRDHDGIQRNIRSLRIPLIITGCFLVSWLPLTVMFTFTSATGAIFGNITWWITAVMAASNCSINMFVYAFGRSAFKKAIRKIFCRSCIK